MVNTSSIDTIPVSASSGRDWAIASAVLVLGLCVFGLTFRSEIETAIYVWINTDAYNHCFLILPVAAYLAWDRRDLIMATTLRPAPALAVLALPMATAWFVADRLGVMEGRQIIALALVEVLFASVLGWQAWRALAVPLLYLFFLVPFGEFLVPPLQALAVHFTRTGLDLVGVPNLVDGVTIQIPEGSFLVHQACSGLRFLAASAAFAVLYACIMYVTPIRRILFIALFLAVAVIGNDFRVLGTILIAHFIGNPQAIETDHVLWGWLFYVIIGAVIVLIGLPFRQDRSLLAHSAAVVSGRIVPASIIALLLVVIPVATPRLAASYINRLGTDAVGQAQIAVPSLPDCTPASLSAALLSQLVPNGLTEGSFSSGYRCRGEPVVLTLHRYPPRISVHDLFLSLHAVETPQGWDIIYQTERGFSAPFWRLTEATTSEGNQITTATAIWIDGKPTTSEIEVRLRQAINTIRPSARSPVLAVITGLDRGAIDTLLGEISGMSEIVGKWIASPGGVNQ